MNCQHSSLLSDGLVEVSLVAEERMRKQLLKRRLPWDATNRKYEIFGEDEEAVFE